MKSFFLLFLAVLCFAGTSFSQIPVAFYDFEDNVSRSTFQNAIELEVNAGGGTALVNTGGTMNSQTGAGLIYGSTASGSAMRVFQAAITSSADPMTAATHYQQFSVSTLGFKGISVLLDVYANNSNAEVMGVLYSTDGVTWNFGGSYDNPGTGQFPFSVGSWEIAVCDLPAAADNRANLRIRLYEYWSSATGSGAHLRFDNLSITATSTTATAGTKTLMNEYSYFAGLSAGESGLLNEASFTADGAGTTVIMGSDMSIGSGSSFNVSNGATFITGGSASCILYGGGDFNLNAGTNLTVRATSGIRTSAANGNIQNTGTRTYSPAANYTYSHVSGTAQNTGNGLPSALTGNLIINNTNGVTLSQAVAMSSPATLYLTNGAFTNGTNLTLNTGTTINRAAGSLVTAPSFNPVINLIYSGSAGITTGFEVPAGTNILDNLTLSKNAQANTVTLGGDVYLNGTLYPNTGTLNLGTKTFHVLSSAASTAAVAAFDGSTAAFAYGAGGGFSVERYLFARKAWRFLATPVLSGSSPSVYAAWQEATLSTASTGYGTQITGPTSSTGFDAITVGYSMKSYDMASDAFLPVTNTANTIAGAQGYMVFVRGDRGVAIAGSTGATTLRIKGQLITGDYPVAVSPGKFQSFGNPYASRIDFRNVTKSGVADAFTIWNPGATGQNGVGGYETYVYDGSDYKKIPGGTIRNNIESGEAVFIQSISGGSVTVTEASKTAGSSVVSFTGNHVPSLGINLLTKDPSGADYTADGVLINFDDSYSNGTDNNDVRKVMNSNDNLSVLRGGQKLTVERKTSLNATDTIFLNLTGTRTAAYHFETDASDIDAPGLQAFLKDKFTATETPVLLSGHTDIGFQITTDPLSKAADRFMIVFRPVAVVPVRFTSIAASRNADKTVTLQWNTQNEIAIEHYKTEHSTDGINFTTFAAAAPLNNNGGSAAYSNVHRTASDGNNYYRVRATDLNGRTEYTAVVKVGALKSIVGLSIYPNPVKDRTLNIRFGNEQPGNYTLQVIENNGRVLQNELLKVLSSNSVMSIPLATTLPAGNYRAVITAADGKKTVINIVTE